MAHNTAQPSIVLQVWAKRMTKIIQIFAANPFLYVPQTNTFRKGLTETPTLEPLLKSNSARICPSGFKLYLSLLNKLVILSRKCYICKSILSVTTSKSALVLDIQWRTFARIPGFSHPSLASDPPSQFEEDFRTLQGNRWVLRPSGIGEAGAPRCRPNPKLSTDTCAAAGGTFGGIWNVSYFQFRFD